MNKKLLAGVKMNIKEKINFLRQHHMRAVYMSKYNLVIDEETKDGFYLQTDGTIHVTKNDEDYEELIDKRESWGFAMVDRGKYEKLISKTNKEISGNWIKLVNYKGWQVRVIKEKDDKYLLIGNGSDILNELGMDRVAKTRYALKWVSKDECSDI